MHLLVYCLMTLQKLDTWDEYLLERECTDKNQQIDYGFAIPKEQFASLLIPAIKNF